MADYIDRQAAKLAIVEEGQRSKRYKIGEFWELNRDEAWNAIDSVPSADVEPVKHGRWTEGGYACGETEWICSECGFSEWRTSNSRMIYCMHCGARMDGEADD